MASENKRGFDIKDRAVGFEGRRRMRRLRQGAGFGVGVDIELLRRRAERGQRGRAVHGPARGWGRTGGHRIRVGSNRAHTRWCSGVEMMVRGRKGRARGGRGGGRGRVRWGRPLLLGGGVVVTGVRPIRGRIIRAAMIKV